MDQLLPLDPAEILTDQVVALTGSGGAGSGIGFGAGGGGGLVTGFNFMGIESKGNRILLIFDVSTSVLNKARRSDMSLAKIKEETINLLRQLPINARFGLIQFTQNFKAFREELLAATDANRAAAKAGIGANGWGRDRCKPLQGQEKSERGCWSVRTGGSNGAGCHLPHFRCELSVERRRQP